MKIIIAGSGKVGMTLLRQLSAEGHDLTLIDMNKQVLDTALEQFDVMTLEGNCAAMEVLLDAGVQNAELLIAATGADEVNLLSCMTAHGLSSRIHTIARVRNPEYTEQIYKMREIFALSLSVNPELQAAKEIERLLKFPGFLRRDTFAKGRAEIVELRVEENSKLRGISLGEMYRIVKCQVLVCTVLRGDTAITPRGDFVLEVGDRIFVTAPTSNLAELLNSLGIISRRVRRCIIGGGGRISFYLAQLLQDDGIQVTLLEKDMDRCRELATQLPGVDVVCGDCSDQNDLESLGIDRCDAYLSATGIDEMNMISSLYAASRGVPHVVTKLSRPENNRLAAKLSVGSVVCPRELCGNDIVRYVRAMQNQVGAAISLHTIADGQAEAVEFLVSDSRYCDIPLKDLKIKKNVLLATISHGNQVEIPGGASMLHLGDSVVVVTTKGGQLQTLADIFA